MRRPRARAVFAALVCCVLVCCSRDPAHAVNEARERARNHTLNGRHAEAVTAWREVVELEDGMEARIALADELRALGRGVEGNDQLRLALRLAPVPAASWYELGQRAERDKRDLSLAARYYRQSVELDERGADGHYALGLALLKTGDFEGASAEIQAALSIAPLDVPWRADAENAAVLAHLRMRERERANAPR